MAPRTAARLTGLLYLFSIAGGFFAEGVVRGGLVVSGDAQASAHNILAQETLYRLGGAADIATLLSDMAIAVLLYRILRPVSDTLALMAALFRAAWCAVFAIATLAHFAPLILLRLPGLEVAPVLALGALRLHTLGYSIGLVFFGAHCLIVGLLIVRSRFLPAVLGWLLAVAGAAYLADSFLNLAAPAVRASLFPWLLLPGFISESLLALWMLAVGLNPARWSDVDGGEADGIH